MDQKRIPLRRTDLVLIIGGVCLLSAIAGASLFALFSDIALSTSPGENGFPRTSIFSRLFRADTPDQMVVVPSSTLPGPGGPTPTTTAPTTSIPTVDPRQFHGPTSPPTIIGPRSNPPNY